MTKARPLNRASVGFFIVALVCGAMSLFLGTQSAHGAIGYPGPVADPSIGTGPPLGSIEIGGATSGWVGGFEPDSVVCYQIDNLPAGCGTVITRGHVGYAFFVLSISDVPVLSQASSQTTVACKESYSPAAQVNGGPFVRVHLGQNMLIVTGISKDHPGGAQVKIGIKLPFVVTKPPCGPTTSTTVPNGSTTTIPNGSTTTTNGGGSTTTTSGGGGSTTTTSGGGSTTTTGGGGGGGGHLPPGIPTYNPATAPASTVAKNAALVVGALAAAAAAASAAAARGAMADLQPLDDGGEEGVVGPDQPLDDGGEEGIAGPDQPLDDGGEGITEEQPLDDGGEEFDV